MESGNHVLKQRFYTIELTDSTVTNFTMISDGAKIVFEFSGYDSLTIRGRYTNLKLQGITFISSNSMNAEIDAYIYSLQEAIFEDCNFHRVGIYMHNVDNAAFSRCNFSDQYPNYYAALHIDYSVAVSVIQSNFINNSGAIYFRPGTPANRYSVSLVIKKCKFINNTSIYRGGSAIYVTGNYFSVIVNQATFIYNTARIGGGGGAINFNGECTSCILSESIFISNSAQYCGAISTGLFGELSNISIIDTAFYYNRAVSGNSIGGGAACIASASSLVTNCTFVGNTAAGYGGAMLVDDSEITITDTVFSNNTAGLSGGALLTYAYPSDYTIISSLFTDNGAGDDGGAMFIGRTGSDVIVERSNFLKNHAADRGGAIAVLGSSVTIYHGTNIYHNTANIGDTISACSSETHLPIVAVGQADPSFFSCIAYDNNIRFSTLSFQELQGYQNITLLVNDLIRDNEIYRNPVVNVSGNDSQQFLNQSITKKLHQTTIIVYISLSLSVILTVMFLLFGIIALVVYCKFRQAVLELKSKSPDHPYYDQPAAESFYEDMLVNEGHDTKAIEMKPNIVYERP
jgi:predicted outer membrane repeat protein